MTHPSSSHEQTSAEILILEAVSKQLGATVVPKRVDFPGGAYVNVDGVSHVRTSTNPTWAPEKHWRFRGA